MKKKKKLSPKAIRLLRRVKRQILQEPKSYDQSERAQIAAERIEHFIRTDAEE